jgi:hypothetical protein
MNKHFIFKAFTCLLLCIGMANAHAAIITGELTDLGSNQWTLDLALTNNDAAGINEFSLYFSEALFSNLQILATPSGWDSIVAQPDIFLSSAGFFDSYNPLALLTGQSQSGFSLSFTYLGQGLPSELAFDIFADNFQWLSSGVSNPGIASVAEPAPLVLFLLGLACVARTRRVNH